ncbi:MAG: discoidin domain-containing protein [Deltaproteobacteria bacterium]|nr:discoidin domain-containing protein [Deltaproteobacteria bacterium]
MRYIDLSRCLLVAFFGLAIAVGQPGCATTKAGGDAQASAEGGDAEEPNPLGENLALNKPAVSSSDEKAEMAPKYAVDGDLSTRWGSNFFTDPDPTVGWIYIDLGEVKTIGTVVITWEAAYGLEYQILVSDDAKEWKVAYHEKDGHVGRSVHKIDPPVQGHYVKLLGIKRGTAYGYSPWEIEVYEK